MLASILSSPVSAFGPQAIAAVCFALTIALYAAALAVVAGLIALWLAGSEL